MRIHVSDNKHFRKTRKIKKVASTCFSVRFIRQTYIDFEPVRFSFLKKEYVRDLPHIQDGVAGT